MAPMRMQKKVNWVTMISALVFVSSLKGGIDVSPLFINCILCILVLVKATIEMKQRSKAIVLMTIIFFSGITQIHSTPSTASVDSLWKQVKEHYKTAPNLALEYAKQLQKEAKLQGNTKREASALWSIGYINYEHGDYNESMEAYFEVLPLYKSLDNNRYLADAYFNIGKIFTDINNHKGAEDFYKRALNLYLLLDYKKGMTKVNYQLGKGYINLNEYEKAEKHLNLALKLSKKYRKSLTQKTYNWLGILAYKKGDTQQAIKYYNQSLALAKIDNNQIEEAMLLYNLGEAYHKANDIALAKEYTKKSLVLSRSIDNLDKQIKPQILLAEIALKERGENKEEVLALVSTIEMFDAGVLNNYLVEALDYVSMPAYRKLLSLEDTNLIINQYAPQTKMANELYENTKTQLLQHSVQISIENVKHGQKLMMFEEKEGLKNWAIFLMAMGFLVIVGLLVMYYKKRRIKFKKQHRAKLETIEAQIYESRGLHVSELEHYITELSKAKENLEKANARLKEARKEIKKREDESIEKSLIIDLKDAEFKEVDDENTDLIKQKMHTNEIMSAMEDKLLEGHDLMHQMNRYIWDVIIELQHKGYNVPPPLWDLRGDRDN